MDSNIRTSKIWIVSLFYAIWLSSITFVFYLEQGAAGLGLQLALVAGGVPVVAQMLLTKSKIRDLTRPFIFTFVFIIIIVLSLIWNITDYFMFVRIFNISLVFFVAIIVASSSDSRIISFLCSGYAVFGSAILLIVNLKGSYIWGRLYTEGIHPNFWGEMSLSVGVTAFALRSRILAVACWSVVLLTLFNTSSRASMVAFIAASIIVAALWFVETERKALALCSVAALLGLSIIAMAFELVPDSFTAFIYQDVFLLEDKGRGLGSGLTGRAEAWIETLEIWMSNPVFGVGFRQHEALLTSASSAHNAYLTMLADTGLFGLMAYVSLISLSLWSAWRHPMPLRVRAVLVAVVASYAVLGLFERRALNAGNPYSILFVICCYYSLRTQMRKPSVMPDQGLRNGFSDMPEAQPSR